MEYVYENGHRRIAYIHGQMNTAVTKARLTSYYRFMESNDLHIPDRYVLEADYLDVSQAMAYTRELLDRKDPPTCILYPDDTALIGGLNEILKGPGGYFHCRIRWQPDLTAVEPKTDHHTPGYGRHWHAGR